MRSDQTENNKRKSFYAFWPLIYTTMVFGGPKKMQTFENVLQIAIVLYLCIFIFLLIYCIY